MTGEIDMSLHQEMKLFQRITSLLADCGHVFPKEPGDQFQDGFQQRILAGEIAVNRRWRDANLACQSADVQIIEPVLSNDRQSRPGNLFLPDAIFNFEWLPAQTLL